LQLVLIVKEWISSRYKRVAPPRSEI